MSRLPIITSEHLDTDQQAVWDNITNGRRGDAARMINAEGGLVGPFNAALHAPVTGKRVVALGESLRFETSLDNRLLELAVCSVGAHWRSNFEWWAHSRLALAAGVGPDVVAAIEAGQEPVFDVDDERAVFAFTRALLDTGRVSDDVYNATRSHVGDQGLVELTQLIGYYCLISLTLNTFRVELPPGNSAIWPY